MTDGRRRSAIGAAGIAVVIIGLAAEWLGHGTRLGFSAQRDLLTGWAVAGSGLIAWASVPSSRIGPLLVASGSTWFIWNAGTLDSIGWLADALTNLCAGILAQALFTWPSGRMERPLDRVLVVAGYVVALFPPLWEHDRSLLAVAALLAFGLIVQYASSSPTSRRARRPAILLGLCLTAVLAGKGVAAVALRTLGVAYPNASIDLWQLAVVCVSIGLTWSLIALDRRRRGAADLVIRLGDERTPVSTAELAAATGLADDAAVREALRRAEEMTARNEGLRAELAAQILAIERSRRRLLEAGDDERAALEERLRRGPVDRLARLGRSLADQRSSIAATAPEATARLDRALIQLEQAQVELAELASGLDPGLLRERGLEVAIRDLAERSPVAVTTAVEAPGELEPTVARTLYYLASEALANVAKHARAAHAWLRLDRDDDRLILAVEDDGVGIGDRAMGGGLSGLRDRLDALGGS